MARCIFEHHVWGFSQCQSVQCCVSRLQGSCSWCFLQLLFLFPAAMFLFRAVVASCSFCFLQHLLYSFSFWRYLSSTAAVCCSAHSLCPTSSAGSAVTQPWFALFSKPLAAKPRYPAAAQANLIKPGGVSKAAENVGKSLIDKLPNAPDISNPEAAEGKPTASKLTQPKQGFLTSFKVMLLVNTSTPT